MMYIHCMACIFNFSGNVQSFVQSSNVKSTVYCLSTFNIEISGVAINFIVCGRNFRVSDFFHKRDRVFCRNEMRFYRKIKKFRLFFVSVRSSNEYN